MISSTSEDSTAGKLSERDVLRICAAFLSGAALRVCDPMLPRLALEFNQTAGSASLVVMVFAIAYSFMQLAFGPLGDRIRAYATYFSQEAKMSSLSSQADSSQGLEGRVVLVTGAGGGLASAIVDRFANAGAKLVLAELRASALSAAQDQLASKGVECIGVECDVSDEASAAKAATAAKNAFGRCDVLINNAGILPPASALQNLSVEAWDRTFAINLRSVFLMTKYIGKLMLDQGSGSIVNIASISGSSPNGCPPYGATKAGVLEFTRHTAVEWGPHGIRTNAVSPGFIMTALSKSNYASEEMIARRVQSVPSRKLGSPEDIAKAVTFLASDDAAFINGHEIIVDGGFLQATLMHVQPPAEQYGGWKPGAQ